jgi:hypothetical protein
MGGIYQSRVAKANAAIAQQNAAKAVQTAHQQAQIGDQEAAQDIGAMMAQAGASGLSLGVGSSALRRRSAEELAARDRGFTVYAGEMEAAGYKQEAANYRSEGRNALGGGMLDAFSSVLSSPSLISSSAKVSPSVMKKLGSNPFTLY